MSSGFGSGYTSSMKIVAIGGGEIGKPGSKVETGSIDQEILRLTGKKKPNILFIPTASSDSEGYAKVVEQHFGKELGAKVDVLWLWERMPGMKEVRQKIADADAVYVGGGDTLKMMKRWRALGIDKLLVSAGKRGCVLAGLSAGSICWSRRFRNPDADLIKVSGLGLIPAVHCPHYHEEKDRQPQLRQLMRKTSGVAIALDNGTALEVVDGQCRILRSIAGAGAYRVYWKGGEFFEERIEVSEDFAPLADLLKK